MDTLEEYVRSRIVAFLESTGISPTRFGRMAVGDPHLVRRIEAGRSLTLRRADRILAFIADYAGGSGGARSASSSPVPGAIERAEENEEERTDERPAEE